MSRRLRPHLFLLATAAGSIVAACGGGSDAPDAVPMSICTDGFDNDGDGSTDYPADPGCSDLFDTDETNPPVAQCSDERDNDGDGTTDYPDDPGCFSAIDNTELDDCPTGPNCPDCSNGTDDDGDTLTDYPQDDGCAAASDPDEYPTDPNACGPGLIVTRIMGSSVTGTLPATPSNLTSVNPGCGGAGGEVAYELVVTEPSVVVLTTDLPQTTVDTVLYVRTQCLVDASEVACNNDSGPAVAASTLTVSLAPGLYYVIVDSRTLGTPGTFMMTIDFYAGEGVACANQAECGPGLQCRIPLGQTEMVCADPVCADGVDDDGDTHDDYPDDPGCEGPGDFDEADDCPTGVNCPACGNGIDDDGDLAIDYPADPDCESAAQPVEGCSNEQDTIATQTTATTTGTTLGASDDFFPSCAFSTNAPDIVTLVDLPAMQTFHVDDAGSTYTTVLAVHDQSCANELACQLSFDPGGESLDLSNLAAGTYAVVMDGYFNAQGDYTLNIGGTIAPLGDCTGTLATAGVISCGPGYACTGGVCLGNLECNNGIDDDGDGAADFPGDPGCGGPNDTTEADDCPSGANCPACANGTDDDGDGDVDYPADGDCSAASDDDESSPACGFETDPFVDFVSGTVTGTTAGAADDFSLSCDFGFNPSPDIVAVAALPAMEFLHVDAAGSSFDLVMGLMDPSCGFELGCDDTFFAGGEIIEVTNIPAGAYSVVMDGYNGNNGPYTINLSGTIAPGGACDGVLASSGALVCPTGYSCSGGICLGSLACNNGIDDDGDGDGTGYPDDPGCTSPTDTSENDSCPGGATCPDCANQIDDDGDGDTDYPDDSSCIAASGASEGTCGFDPGGVTQVVIPIFSANTSGGGDDFTPQCTGSIGGSDRAFALTLPVPVARLEVDTHGSSTNTIVSVMNSACTGTVACNDDAPPWDGSSELTVFGLAAGQYGIIVDSWFDGDFLLNVRGTVDPGTSCTSPLFSTGVLVCPANHICTAGTCQSL
jgi:hypothetical protein